MRPSPRRNRRLPADPTAADTPGDATTGFARESTLAGVAKDSALGHPPGEPIAPGFAGASTSAGFAGDQSAADPAGDSRAPSLAVNSTVSRLGGHSAADLPRGSTTSRIAADPSAADTRVTQRQPASLEIHHLHASPQTQHPTSHRATQRHLPELGRRTRSRCRGGADQWGAGERARCARGRRARGEARSRTGSAAPTRRG